MSLTHRFATECSTNPKSNTRIITNLLIASTLAVIACCLFATPTHAQSLSLGSITVAKSLVTCPAGAGWYSYSYVNSNGQTVTVPMNCQEAVMSCPNTRPTPADFRRAEPCTGVPDRAFAGEGCHRLPHRRRWDRPGQQRLPQLLLPARLHGRVDKMGGRLGECFRPLSATASGKHPERCLPSRDLSALYLHHPLSECLTELCEGRVLRTRAKRGLGSGGLRDGVLRRRKLA